MIAIGNSFEMFDAKFIIAGRDTIRSMTKIQKDSNGREIRLIRMCRRLHCDSSNFIMMTRWMLCSMKPNGLDRSE